MLVVSVLLSRTLSQGGQSETSQLVAKSEHTAVLCSAVLQLTSEHPEELESQLCLIRPRRILFCSQAEAGKTDFKGVSYIVRRIACHCDNQSDYTEGYHLRTLGGVMIRRRLF
jgi:hypothetical protein